MRPTRGVRRLAAPVPALSMMAMALVARVAGAQSAAPRTMSLTDCVADRAPGEPRRAVERVRGPGSRGAARRGPWRLRAQAPVRRERPAVVVAVLAVVQAARVSRCATRSPGRRASRSSSRSRRCSRSTSSTRSGSSASMSRRSERAATRRQVAFHTIEAYYRLLEAERLAEVANASVTQLESQQRQAQSQFDNGVIGKNDLLRAGLALAGARQRSIQTRGQVILAHGQLAAAMGRSPDQVVEPEPFVGEPPPLAEGWPRGRRGAGRGRAARAPRSRPEGRSGPGRTRLREGAPRSAGQRGRQLHPRRWLSLPADGRCVRRAGRHVGRLGLGNDHRRYPRGRREARTRRSSRRRSCRTTFASRRARRS